MTLIERDHLLAHMTRSDQRPRNFSGLVPNPQTQIDTAQNQTRNALAHKPHMRRDIGLPPEHKPPDLIQILFCSSGGPPAIATHATAWA